MNYYKLLTKQGYLGDCYVINKIYPETFKESENSSCKSVLKMQRAYPNDWEKVPAGEYFVQEGKMPKYFAIKRVADNSLWKKYIYWLNNTYFSNITGYIDEYYGFDSRVFIDPKLKYFKNNPVELTLEQWDKIINKTMEEKFKLPEKWCVLSQGKDTYEKYLQPYLVKHGYENPEWNERDYYYSYVKGEFYADSYPEIRGCVEITFEQFIKHVLKEEVMKENDKEIIGWKLKDDCKKNSKAAFYICTGYTNDNGIYGNVESSHDIEKLKDAGVLELWFEPVFTEEFEVGDWITVIEDISSGWLKNTKCRTFQITREKNKYQRGEYFGVSGAGYTNVELYAKFRLATPEEIKAAQIPQITINGYKGEFFDNYVKFGCAEIDKNWFLQFYEIMRTITYSNKEIEFVTIGKGTFAKDQIKEIAEYYNKK